MYCLHCGQELPDNAGFCFSCGKKIEIPLKTQEVPKSNSGLINAKCTNCGAALEVDPKQEAAICKYCGSAFIVERAINNYNVTNNQNISADTVNIYSGEGQTGFNIRAGILYSYKGESVDVKIPDNVEAIAESAFENMPIRSVEIPEGVETIGRYAFRNTKIEELVLPQSVRFLDELSFGYNKALKSVTFEGATTIKNYSFNGCTNLTSITIKSQDFNRFELEHFGCQSVDQIICPEVLQAKADEVIKNNRKIRWMTAGLCGFCGGELSKISKKCTLCGKKKDY